MRRDTDLLRSRRFDVVVVGGGVHGAWIALRAAEAGLGVALVEQDDFGAATSSNSLNILHGGLRYLQHLDFARMRASIRARREFCRRFPHLVRPLQCLMPLKAAGVRSPWILGPALLLNDLVSHDRNDGVDEGVRLPAGRLLDGARCRAAVDPLASTPAFAGAIWWDAVTLDPGRMVLETVMAAADAGATVANHVRALEYLIHDRAVEGVAVSDAMTGEEFEIRANVVVNAAGPWAGELSSRGRLATAFLPQGWVGGLNVVLRRSLGIETAVALSAASKQADRSAVVHRATRELFFVPWRGVTAIGTDYLPVADPGEARQAPGSLVERFVDEIDRVAPKARIEPADVAALQWGLLPKEPGETPLPVKSPVLVAGEKETGARGLVVVIGEKLTSAPTLSAAVLERALGELQGGPAKGHASPERARQGSPPGGVSGGRPVRPPGVHAPGDVPREFSGPEVVHAIREEMAMGLEDLVLRRLGLGYLGHPGVEVLRRCARLAAPEFGWSVVEEEMAVADLDTFLRRSVGSRPHGSVAA